VSTAVPPAAVADAEAPMRGPLTRSFARGFVAFLITAALAEAIGLAEYAASGGAYRLWTWMKVGFLYLVSFFGVQVRLVFGSGFVPGLVWSLRMPLLVGTGLAGWLLFRGGRRGSFAGAVSMALGFAVPTFLVALPSTLRFPSLRLTVGAVLWQAAVFPLVFALGVTAAGAWSAGSPGSVRAARLRAAARGGGRMFARSLVLAFAGLLVLAAVRSAETGAYARGLRHLGWTGALTVGHQLLGLPNIATYVLASSMGGATELQLAAGGPAGAPGLEVRMSGVQPVGPAEGLAPNAGAAGAGGIGWGGWFYLFLLVPAVATVLGGREAAAGARGIRRRVAAGVGAGIVFGGFVAVAAWLSAAVVPLPLYGVVPVAVRAVTPGVAMLGLAWGVAGGAIGAMLPDQNPEGLEPAPGPGPLGEAPPPSPTSA